ncbi:hypothetical protein [Acinetobacter wuhouensis]|uniref:Uncharacterized protein n=1 Tax=Acinetobacter wuhouensis TaxID=1879050 RepID=A0A4Q7AJ02_9GAMM|nr:hypothetical protein [Acinetobacter wuhouensis]RZG42855.1 hypothetical protein EXU28_18480 [Acinetobacter wuhouensis]
MIICESLEYVESVAQEMGRSCVHLDLFTMLNSFMTVTQANQILALEAVIYAVMISYVWVVKGSQKIDG